MEKILEEINNEIKKTAQSEEIDTQKLTELIETRNRLKAYNTGSVSQIQGFNNPIYPTFPALGNIAVGNSIFDGMRDLAEMYFKSQTEQLKNKNNVNIFDLAFYHRFISDLNPIPEKINDYKKVKDGIEELIIKEFKNIIEEKKLEQNNTEKDKILETTVEVKKEQLMEAQI